MVTNQQGFWGGYSGQPAPSRYIPRPDPGTSPGGSLYNWSLRDPKFGWISLPEGNTCNPDNPDAIYSTPGSWQPQTAETCKKTSLRLHDRANFKPT